MPLPQKTDPRTPVRPPPGAIPKLGVKELQYYTAEVHKAAFALPKFAADALTKSLTFQ